VGRLESFEAFSFCAKEKYNAEAQRRGVSQRRKEQKGEKENIRRVLARTSLVREAK
jgi:hypothetical protein